MITNFKSLKIWSRSINLASRLYKMTDSFSDHERFGLTSQIRRAAVSVPANIAEGCGRGTKRDLSRFLDISIGSLCEIETLLTISSQIDEMKLDEALMQEVEEIRKMIVGYQKSLN